MSINLSVVLQAKVSMTNGSRVVSVGRHASSHLFGGIWKGVQACKSKWRIIRGQATCLTSSIPIN